MPESNVYAKGGYFLTVAGLYCKIAPGNFPGTTDPGIVLRLPRGILAAWEVFDTPCTVPRLR